MRDIYIHPSRALQASRRTTSLFSRELSVKASSSNEEVREYIYIYITFSVKASNEEV